VYIDRDKLFQQFLRSRIALSHGLIPIIFFLRNTKEWEEIVLAFGSSSVQQSFCSSFPFMIEEGGGCVSRGWKSCKAK